VLGHHDAHSCRLFSSNLPLRPHHVITLGDMFALNEIIKESGLKVIAANELGDAAKKVVTVANIVETAKAANIKVSFSP